MMTVLGRPFSHKIRDGYFSERCDEQIGMREIVVACAVVRDRHATQASAFCRETAGAGIFEGDGLAARDF